VATPAEMFLRVLSESVQNLGYFKAVVTPPFSGLTDYDLETTILEFEQNFMRPQSRFIFVLQADLVNSKTNRIVASKRFKSVVPAKMNNAFGGVLAANQAAAEVAQQVARFARNYARAR
jgi:cholesterol transport system auxiliary component